MRRILWLGLAALAACNPGRDRLLADLQSDRAERRALAVKKLGEEKRADDIVIFTRAARDASATVRAEAATALGLSQVPEVVDLVGELVEDSDEQVQEKAVAALAQFPGEKPRRFLTIQYGRRGRTTRRAIQSALEGNGTQGAAALLVKSEATLLWERNLKLLQSGTLAERVSASEALGQSGRPEAVELLLARIKDPQIPLAAAAVRGLTRSRDPKAIPPIVGALAEPYAEIREAGLEGVRTLQPPEAVAGVVAIAREGSATSGLAVSVLSELAPQEAVNAALCSVALEGEGEPALAAARAMGGRGGCPNAPFPSLLGPRVPTPRVQSALRVIAALGPSAHTAVAPVTAQLAAKDPNTVALAATALGAIGDRKSTPALEALYAKQWAIVAAAREDWVKDTLPNEPVTGFDPMPLALSTLSDFAPNGAEHGRFTELLAKVDALDEQRRGGEAAERKSGSATEDLLPDRDTAAAQLAAAALGAVARLGAPEAGVLVRRHLADPDAALREAALMATPSLGTEGIAMARQRLPTLSLERRTALARALCALGAEGKKAVLEVLPQLPAGHGVSLLDALDKSGTPPEAGPVLEAVFRRGGGEAVLAARMLGNLKARSAVAALVESLRDPTSVARREALIALGQIGDPSAADEVARDLWHDSAEVRAAAAGALATLGVSNHRAMLEALGQDYYRTVRDEARAALAAPTAPTPGRTP